MEWNKIWCYTCKHNSTVAGEYDPYCEKNCGDAWNGYEPNNEVKGEEDNEDD